MYTYIYIYLLSVLSLLLVVVVVVVVIVGCDYVLVVYIEATVLCCYAVFSSIDVAIVMINN